MRTVNEILIGVGMVVGMTLAGMFAGAIGFGLFGAAKYLLASDVGPRDARAFGEFVGRHAGFGMIWCSLPGAWSGVGAFAFRGDKAPEKTPGAPAKAVAAAVAAGITAVVIWWLGNT